MSGQVIHIAALVHPPMAPGSDQADICMQGMLEILLQVYLIFWGRADCSALMGPALHLDMLAQSDCRDLRMWPHGLRASLLDRSAHCTVTNTVMPACAVPLSAPEVLWLIDTLLYL